VPDFVQQAPADGADATQTIDTASR
jgi:hypothetical protein